MHPEQPANTVTREEFDRIWRHSVLLLQRGFLTGSILTVDDEDAEKMGPPWTRRYIYNHSSCGMCSGRVRTWDMATRTVYACDTCQVRPPPPPPSPVQLPRRTCTARRARPGGTCMKLWGAPQHHTVWERTHACSACQTCARQTCACLKAHREGASPARGGFKFRSVAVSRIVCPGDSTKPRLGVRPPGASGSGSMC